MDRNGIKSFFQNPLVDMLFRLVAVVALVIGAAASMETRALSKCQIKYQEYYNARTRTLTENADRERQIQRDFFKAQADLLLNPATLTPREERTAEEQKTVDVLGAAWVKAHQTQLSQQANFDRVREENPVPPPPSEFCKG